VIESVTDTQKLYQLIRNSNPNNLKCIYVDQIEKDSVKKMLKQLELCIGKQNGHVIFVKK